MKKYPHLILFCICVFVTFAERLNAQETTNDYYPPTPVPDRIMLNLTDQPTTSMAVTWRTSLAVRKGMVQVNLALPSPDLQDSARTITATTESFLSDRNGAHYHSVVIDSLEASTQYAYRVGDGTHWSEWAHFKTASEEKKPLSFIYFGDAQNDLKSRWSRTIRGAFRQMPKADFLLHAGDLVNRANSDHEWGEWFYAGGWIYRMMPSVATPGNHEYYRGADDKYYLSHQWEPTFTFPENGPEGSRETVYYIDYQDLRIISLNSISYQISEADSAAQVKWLTNLLENNPQKWTVVTMHYPVYSTKLGRDNEEIRNGLQPIFEKYKVDLVLQGHDHAYGRGTNLPTGAKKESLQGPIYVVSVSGPKMYDQGLEEWMQWAASNTQLYQLIKIDGDNLRYEAYTVADELYDVFELNKQSDGSNRFMDLTTDKMQERLDLPKRYQEGFTKEQWEGYRMRFKAYKERKKKQE